MTAALLPPNATALERALADLSGTLLDIDVPIDRLWSADTCPAPLLGYLAWSLAVDEWDPAWPNEVKRAVIRAAIPTHRAKGTAGAVKRAIAALGYTATVQDAFAALSYDGSARTDGLEDYGSGGRWAQFDVLIDLGDRALDQDSRRQLSRAIKANAPARSHLRRLGFALTDTDSFSVRDQLDLTVRMAITDQRAWGTLYNGRLIHAGAQRQRHDGMGHHDALWSHDGWSQTGTRHDSAQDQVSMDLAMTLGDTVRVDLRHDGRLAYQGPNHGVGAVAVDSASAIHITTHYRHDGRHRYGGDRHDGSQAYGGQRSYYTGIRAAGTTTHHLVM